MIVMRRLFILLATVIFSCHQTTANDINHLLDLLDQAIDNRHTIIEQKRTELEALKQMLSLTPANARYELCEEICNMYEGFNTDSALLYSNLCIKYAHDPGFGSEDKIQRAMIHQAQNMAVSGLYQKVREVLSTLEPVLLEQNRYIFYRTKAALYVWETEFSTLPGAFEASLNDVISIRDSLAKYNTNPLLAVHEKSIIASYYDYQEGMNLVKPVLDTISLDNPYLRFLANTAATCSENLEGEEAASYYYALSALSDVSQGILEHSSLRRLATILFSKGDISRAYKYINCCMEDAEMCGARLRTIQMAEDLPVILNAYQSRVNNQKRHLIEGVIVLVLLLIGISWSLWYTNRIKQRLKKANDKILEYHEGLRQNKIRLEQTLQQLKQSNLSLKESNQIKIVYITQYMKQCSENIDKIEAYQTMMQKVARTSNYAKLLQTIKDTEMLDHEVEDFNLSFDKTFLGLFPTFIEDLNRLLKPEEQLHVPENNRLTTELRIFALVRLGISDSEEIASLLRYSVKTIYNYRTKVRNKAIGDRTLLEEQIKRIGMSEN